MTASSRRAFLTRAATLGSGMLLASHFGWPPALERLVWADAQHDGSALAGGERLGVLPFAGEGDAAVGERASDWTIAIDG